MQTLGSVILSVILSEAQYSIPTLHSPVIYKKQKDLQMESPFVLPCYISLAKL